MTAKQITKALLKSGISLDGLEVRKDEIEVYCTDSSGEIDREQTEAKSDLVASAFGWGGYKCGYGGWVMREGVESSGDWNDVSSRHHY